MFYSDLNTVPPIQHKLAKIPSDFPGRFPAFSKAAPGHAGHPLPCVPGAHAVDVRRCRGSRPFLRRPPRPRCSPALPPPWGMLAAAGGDACGWERPWLCRLPAAGARSFPRCLLLAAEAGALGRDDRRERLREALLDGMWLTGGRGQLRGHSRRFPLARRWQGNCSAFLEGPVPSGGAGAEPLARLGSRRARAGGPPPALAPEHLLRGVETPQGQGLEQSFLRPRQNERSGAGEGEPSGAWRRSGSVPAPPRPGCPRERQGSPQTDVLRRCLIAHPGQRLGNPSLSLGWLQFHLEKGRYNHSI
ncbi:uncharacterized protein LOC128804955 [Vidua macroura]|uniref:uncharacterized protein LOC128804955 n=1 Tax=Vidua macroura TaxID=187451 RepID=UPI0023A87BB1|nr:uncharacterized protein LOC128804955 [Vidua macroura]